MFDAGHEKESRGFLDVISPCHSRTRRIMDAGVRPLIEKSAMGPGDGRRRELSQSARRRIYWTERNQLWGWPNWDPFPDDSQKTGARCAKRRSARFFFRACWQRFGWPV